MLVKIAIVPESGLLIGQSFGGVLYADDMLWDGESLEESHEMAIVSCKNCHNFITKRF